MSIMNKFNKSVQQDDSFSSPTRLTPPSSRRSLSEGTTYYVRGNNRNDEMLGDSMKNRRGSEGLSKRISSSGSASPTSVAAVKHFDMGVDFTLTNSHSGACIDPTSGIRLSDIDCRRRLSTTQKIPSSSETIFTQETADNSDSSFATDSDYTPDEKEGKAKAEGDLSSSVKELFATVPTPPLSSQQHSEVDIPWLRGGGTIPLEAKAYRHHHRKSSRSSSSTFSVISSLLNPISNFIQSLSTIGEWVEQTPFRSWVVLGCAISIEIFATILLKMASNSTSNSLSDTATKGDDSVFSSKFWMTCFSLFMDLSSILAMGATLKNIEVGVAYAVWSAVGTAVVSIFGIMYWDESKSPTKLISLVLIILGVIGLNLSDDSEH